MTDSEPYGELVFTDITASEERNNVGITIDDEMIDMVEAQDQMLTNDEEDFDSGYSTDEIDDIYESQLLDAQQQWDESIEQLNKVLNWVLLPIIGKFMGRRLAKTIWQRVMEHCWR